MAVQKVFKYFKGTKDEFATWLASHPERKSEVDKCITFIHPRTVTTDGTIYTRGDYYDIKQTNVSIVGGTYIGVATASGVSTIDIKSDMILNIEQLYAEGYNDKLVTKAVMTDYVKHCLGFENNIQNLN